MDLVLMKWMIMIMAVVGACILVSYIGYFRNRKSENNNK
jgi:uncharacterized membrane protein YeaQ/YmgE (transglycosylase-associated protein family)